MTFEELEIIDPILRAIKEVGYTQPTPIQEKSIPSLLQRKDLLGCAQTGTGKTAAFAIPILQHIYNDKNLNGGFRNIKSLIVTPTRELAIQIEESFTKYGKYTGIKNTVIFGGVKQGGQTQTLRKGVDVLIATPGRLLDLMSQGFVSLRNVEYFVLDEADRMLDMGFIHDIRKIIAKLTIKRQSLFFSATMPLDIIQLSHKILGGKPEKVTVQPEQTTAEKVEQAVYFVNKRNKPKLLTHLLKTVEYESVLVFSRTKYGADKIVKFLKKVNIVAEAIHGNKSQGARQRALTNFKSGETKILVATDIAARGIDIKELSLVINFDLPNISETYIHRIGRTGRAGFSGIALSFCDVEERAYLRDIQKLINQRITVIEDHPFIEDADEVPKKKPAQQRGQRQQQQQPRSRHGERDRDSNNKRRRKYYRQGASKPDRSR
ncbi:MAG: DEAD/DEAH box helicase [Draconibacterium sp.]|nr:DEAD/DEAH box helicase [Draconibacterium sp.]